MPTKSWVVKTASSPNKATSCSCSKSRCLKLYCECFQQKKTCGLKCTCRNCHNNNEAGEIRTKTILEILARRPDAFDQREKKNADDGCACKKNKCLKKYCVCYNAGIPCEAKCKCNDCQNKPSAATSALAGVGGDPRLAEQRDPLRDPTRHAYETAVRHHAVYAPYDPYAMAAGGRAHGGGHGGYYDAPHNCEGREMLRDSLMGGGDHTSMDFDSRDASRDSKNAPQIAFGTQKKPPDASSQEVVSNALEGDNTHIEVPENRNALLAAASSQEVSVPLRLENFLQMNGEQYQNTQVPPAEATLLEKVSWIATRLRHLQADLESKQEENDTLKDAKSDLVDGITEKQSEIVRLRKEKSDLCTRLEEVESIVETKQTEITTLKAQLDKSSQSCSSIQAQLEESKSKLLANEEVNRHSEAALAAAELAIESKQSEISISNQTNEDLRKQLESVRESEQSQITSLQAQLQASKSKLRELEKKVPDRSSNSPTPFRQATEPPAKRGKVVFDVEVTPPIKYRTAG